MTVRWLTAFLDRPADSVGRVTEFCQKVTGSTLSAWRGEREEFATLLPADGDAYLRVQRVEGGKGGSHLDLHVDDIARTAGHAEELGAARHLELDDVTVMRSPADLAFCVVGYDGESVRPAPTAAKDGSRTLVDQLCLDIPPGSYEQECRFWAALTGWEHCEGRLPEFTYLERPAGMPLRLLFQRVDDSVPGQQARAHLDLACDDVEAAAQAHEHLGAQVLARFPFWITMADPAGEPYCLTRRTPD